MRLDPRKAMPPLEEVGDRVTVTLEMSVDTFDRLAPGLDKLVAEFDLVSHATLPLAATRSGGASRGRRRGAGSRPSTACVTRSASRRG